MQKLYSLVRAVLCPDDIDINMITSQISTPTDNKTIHERLICPE